MLEWQPEVGRPVFDNDNPPRGLRGPTLAAGPDMRRQTIAFLLFPGFSLLSLSSFLVPFEKANAVLDEALFDWHFASRDGKPVTCSGGFEVPATRSFAGMRPEPGCSRKPDMVVLVSGSDVENQVSPELSGAIRICRRQGIPIVALGTATWLLAAMGALHGATCTIHWEKMAAFAETFDGPKIIDSIYADDGGITSCAGEFAAFDLAVGLIAKKLGSRVAEDVCSRAITDRPREATAPQNRVAWIAFEGVSRKLVQAIRLMEQNLQEPIDLAVISRRLSVSRRQIERLFGTYVGTTPHKYYLKLRLDRARQLLEGTGMPVVEVAIACGFVSPSHFTKCFRQHHHLAPTEVRRARNMSVVGLDPCAYVL